MSTQPTNSNRKKFSNNLNRRAGFHSVAITCATGLIMVLGFIAVPSAQAQTFSILYSFTSESDGDRPDSLVQDSKGNFYGTTLYGGTSGNGTIFKIDPAGRKTTLYSFKNQPDGSEPIGIIRDSSGNLYGTTLYGGVGCPGGAGCGTVFKLNASGKETVLHRFAHHGDGSFPQAGLVMDSAGKLYGTTTFGGILTCGGSGWGCGTVFKLDPSGNETVLYRFKNGTDGGSPNGLTLDAEGNLYGTAQGGANHDGTIFEIDASGKFTVLHTFYGTDGCIPFASLTLDASGNLYGTAGNCGQFGFGTVFKLDPSGDVTVLYNFTGGSDGAYPSGTLVLDQAGNLYGTTGFGGDLTSHCGEAGNTPGCGVVFKIDTAGQYSVLHTFDGNDGQWAYYGVIRDAEGNLYGTTAEGGTKTCYCGVVYKVTQ